MQKSNQNFKSYDNNMNQIKHLPKQIPGPSERKQKLKRKLKVEFIKNIIKITII